MHPKESLPTVAAQKKNPKEYGADSITILEGLEAVRKRPGMYIGSTGERGLHHLVWEVVDNAVDEAMAGYANTVDVKILENGGVQVTDNGRGIPVAMHATGVPTVDVVMTQLHAEYPSLDIHAHVVEGHAGEVLVAASKPASLLVVASRGHRALAGVVLGSVGLHCVTMAACPVVVYREPKSHD